MLYLVLLELFVYELQYIATFPATAQVAGSGCEHVFWYYSISL